VSGSEHEQQERKKRGTKGGNSYPLRKEAISRQQSGVCFANLSERQKLKAGRFGRYGDWLLIGDYPEGDQVCAGRRAESQQLAISC